MSKQWLSFAKSKSPNGRFTEIAFAEAINKMRLKFHLTEQQIEFMLNWIRNDDFWCTNALSPVSLLKKSKSCPEITKLEQVINRIKARKKTEKEKLYDAAMKFDADLKAEENTIDLDQPLDEIPLPPEMTLLAEKIDKEFN